MKYLLAIALFALSAFAEAAPMPDFEIRSMVAQIDEVMDSRLCAVANDTRDRGAELMTVTLRLKSDVVLVRKILVNDYNWMRSTGYTKGPDGRWLMSARAIESCTTDALGDRCIAFRSYFKRFFPSVSPPGGGVRVVNP